MKAAIDEIDFELVSKYTWYAMKADDVDGFYAATRISTPSGDKTILMHRLILGLYLGDERKADHKEPSKTLDNRRRNLRIANDTESVQNRRNQINNTSGCKGVRFDKRRNKWQARIKVGRKEKHLGYFDTIQEASVKRAQEELNLFGDFAREELKRSLVLYRRKVPE